MARTLQPAALAFVPYGFVLVRVRVRGRQQDLSEIYRVRWLALKYRIWNNMDFLLSRATLL
jgi:hypothetical protein